MSTENLSLDSSDTSFWLLHFSAGDKCWGIFLICKMLKISVRSKTRSFMVGSSLYKSIYLFFSKSQKHSLLSFNSKWSHFTAVSNTVVYKIIFELDAIFQHCLINWNVAKYELHYFCSKHLRVPVPFQTQVKQCVIASLMDTVLIL